MPIFTDENIAKLFGAEAAEDETEDRFRQYFFFNRTYDNLVSDLPLRILVGHKGVGKSALLKRAKLNDDDNKVLSVWLTPGDIASVANRDTGEDFTKLVEYWKQGIFAILAKHILGEAANDLLNKEKMGGFASRIATFIPAVTAKFSEKIGVGAADVNREVVANFKKTGVVNVYIDDIDRGWSASKSDIKNISALLGSGLTT
jgi:hypothetical protein